MRPSLNMLALLGGGGEEAGGGVEGWSLGTDYIAAWLCQQV